GCDWIVANDVSEGTGVFGGDNNTVCLLTGDGAEVWPEMTKEEVATRLVERIAATIGPGGPGGPNGPNASLKPS
ncbi:MAG TPA: hypothetical protein ENI55_04265, partial [Alphaproteobacteria bacterium]|nr:hypothetical protein [Alphaproteobacteria bacterium]